MLDAFEHLLNDRGERSATIEAVAAEAGVSKGGLLYHFASKNDLVEGLIERLDGFTAADHEGLRGAPEGVLRRFIRTSVQVDGAFDRTYIAIARLAQSDRYPAARDALARVEAGWRGILEESLGDATVARLALLVSDGLYYNAALFAGATDAENPDQLEGVIDAIEELARVRKLADPGAGDAHTA